jgi:hypothetical protein
MIRAAMVREAVRNMRDRVGAGVMLGRRTFRWNCPLARWGLSIISPEAKPPTRQPKAVHSLFIAGLSLVVSSLTLPLRAQVQIEVSARQFKINEKITAKVVNTTHRTIAYCVGHGPWEGPNGRIVWVSSPFGILQKGERGKWGIELTGIDVGTSLHLQELYPGNSEEYWFPSVYTGERRLFLEYTFDSGESVNCSDPHRKWRRVRSQAIIVR